MTKKRIICLVILGLLLSGVSVLATYLIESSDVGYDNSTSELSSDNVEGAINELYVRTATLQSENAALQEQLANAVSQEDLDAALAACPEGNICMTNADYYEYNSAVSCSTTATAKSVGDTAYITVKGVNENFHVISSNGCTTTLIADYNVSTSTGKQATSGAGTLAFSDSTNKNYWYDGSALKTEYAAGGASFSGNPYPYVYNSKSKLYSYVEDYKTYLNGGTSGPKVKAARLATYEELVSLGCTDSSTCPSWIKNTDFWTGSARLDNYVLSLYSYYGRLGNSHYSTFDGVRPVIIVSTSEL